MFSLRDTLAAAFLGVPMPKDNNATAVGVKKGKKRSNKKKSKKAKAEVKHQDEDDDNDYESLNDGSDKEDADEDELIPGVAVISAQTTSSESAKLAAALIYQYESTQLGKLFCFASWF